MRISILILIVAFGFSFSTSAQEANTNETGKVYFFRFNGLTGGTYYNIFIDNKLVCKLKNNRYSVHEVSAGKHICSVQFNGKESKEKTEKFEIEIESGQSVYLYTYIKMSLLTYKVLFNEITEDKVKILLEEDKKMKEVDECL